MHVFPDSRSEPDFATPPPTATELVSTLTDAPARPREGYESRRFREIGMPGSQDRRALLGPQRLRRINLRNPQRRYKACGHSNDGQQQWDAS